jgi:hypothetical protein
VGWQARFSHGLMLDYELRNWAKLNKGSRAVPKAVEIHRF